MDEICYETLHHRRDGSTYEVEIRLQLLRHETPPVFVAIARDITERSHFETLIRRQSLYDALTLLPNRTLFNERLTMALEDYQASTAPWRADAGRSGRFPAGDRQHGQGDG